MQNLFKINYNDITMNLTKKETELLLSSPLFAGMDSRGLSDALEAMNSVRQSYKKGTFLHEAGTLLSAFGFVLGGVVHACHDDLSGRRLIMAEVQKGQTFGESLAFLGVSESAVYITAATDCTVLWLQFPASLSAELSHRFTAMLARRTLSMNTRIQILSRPRLREKILMFLQEQAQQQESRYLHLSMNRDDMAAYIGADRSALSRELAKMKAEGIIDYYKNTFEIK